MDVITEKRRRPSSEATLADQAYYMIRERILRGQLSLGAVLSRRKLAAEFGMSLLPLSEALQMLESEGLVESQPRVGTRVRTPTPEEIRGRFVVREALEAESAGLCCRFATFPERLELRRMGEQVDTLLNARVRERANDRDFFYVAQEHHVNLHMRIAEFARCVQLRQAIERNHLMIYDWFYAVSAPDRLLPEKYHSELVEKVTGDDPDAASQAMRAHIRIGLDTVLEKLSKVANGTDWRPKRGER